MSDWTERTKIERGEIMAKIEGVLVVWDEWTGLRETGRHILMSCPTCGFREDYFLPPKCDMDARCDCGKDLRHEDSGVLVVWDEEEGAKR